MTCVLMDIKETKLQGLLVLEPKVFGDSRGFFLETYNKERYQAAGINPEFVQDNISFSQKGVLRGLHFQNPQPQGKLVQVLSGAVLDVAVDIRIGSATFGCWHGEVLSGENCKQMYIPEGFAHGFCVISQTALFSYKCTNFYSPSTEGGVLWSDPDIGIDWQVNEPILSPKDSAYPRLKDIPRQRLPIFKEHA
jgi:dTDP-4-dehydrorhamnose 3,5-epimerase